MLWMLHFLPDALILTVVYVVLAIGAVATIIGIGLNLVPAFGNLRLPLQLIGVLCLTLGMYFFAGYGVEMEWQARIKELEEKVRVAEAKAAKTNVIIQEKIVYKTKIVKEKEIQYVDRIKEIAKEIDAKCEVDPRVVETLNQAAEDPNKEAAK